MPKSPLSATSRISNKFLQELDTWHSIHGYDFAKMIEESPELYKRLLNEPKLFAGSELGRDYSRLIKLTVGRAEKSQSYKDVFDTLAIPMSPKDYISIGRVSVAADRRKKRKPK